MSNGKSGKHPQGQRPRPNPGQRPAQSRPAPAPQAPEPPAAATPEGSSDSPDIQGDALDSTQEFDTLSDATGEDSTDPELAALAGLTEAPLPVAYPPVQENAAANIPTYVPPAEPEPEAAPAVEPVGLFFCTDRVSVGPYEIGGKKVVFRKGELYPQSNDPNFLKAVNKGYLRVATDKDKTAAGYGPSGPNGAVTAASLSGIGVKR